MPPELLAVQRTGTGTPVVRVTVSDRLAGLPRLRWQRLYAGAEDDYHHAAVCSGDGTLVRLRVNAAAQGYLQVVLAPGPGSDFGSWIAMGTLSSVSGVAATAGGTSVVCFVVASDQRSIVAVESTDSGHSFGAGVLVTTAPAAVGYLAAGISGTGVVRLFYTVGATVYSVARTGGSWGTPTVWPNAVASVTGLACAYHLDWNLVVAGADSGGAAHLWTCLFGDGYGQPAGTWSALTSIARADPGSGVSFQSPHLDWADTARLWFVEKYTGPGAYSRPYRSALLPAAGFADALWREPAPFDLTSAYGLAPAHDAGSAWLSAPFGIWRADRTALSVDVSPAVAELLLEARPFGGNAALTLENAGGKYGPATPVPLVPGAEVAVALGYRTPAGDRTAPGPAFWVRTVRRDAGGGRARVQLDCVDAWGLLEAWRARQQFAWGAGDRNLYQLLAFVLARAGLGVGILGSTDAFLSLQPAFTIQPGESGLAAVRRLLAMSGDLLFFEGDFGFVVAPSQSDPAVYSYGEGHPIRQCSAAAALSPAGHVQVFGRGAYGEAFHWEAVDAWPGPVRKVMDANVTSAGAAATRAAAEVRLQAVWGDAGFLEAPVNCGQQLYDVVTVTEGGAGLAAAARRVNGVRVRYRRSGAAVYDMRLDLGEV